MARTAVISVVVMFVTAWLLPASSSAGPDVTAKTNASSMNVASR